MTGATSRRKGATWQRSVRQWAERVADNPAEVTTRSCGEDGDDVRATICGVPLSLEAKNAKAHDLAGWLDQALGNAGDDRVAVVVAHRRGRAGVGDGYLVTTPDEFAAALAIAYCAGEGAGRPPESLLRKGGAA